MLIFAPPAVAAQAWPTPARGAPYNAVRAHLIRLGIDPVPVTAKPGSPSSCPTEDAFCRAYPEIAVCGVGHRVQLCHHLFRRRSDGRLLMVQTAGEADVTRDPPDFSGVVYQRLFTPSALDLSDLLISSPAGRGRD